MIAKDHYPSDVKILRVVSINVNGLRSSVNKGPAVKGNIVHIDYEGLLEGKPFNGGTAQNQTLQLGSGRMIPGFEEGILGHKGGEEFDIFVTFPARYHVSDLAGKPVVFKIKLHDVCVRQLPTP